MKKTLLFTVAMVCAISCFGARDRTKSFVVRDKAEWAEYVDGREWTTDSSARGDRTEVAERFVHEVVVAYLYSSIETLDLIGPVVELSAEKAARFSGGAWSEVPGRKPYLIRAVFMPRFDSSFRILKVGDSTICVDSVLVGNYGKEVVLKTALIVDLDFTPSSLEVVTGKAL